MQKEHQIPQTATSQPKFTAKWIAPLGGQQENFYFLARKSFQVPRELSKVILWITADSQYAVYLNDQFIGNGPVRGSHRRAFVDRYDITKLLKKGKNWIAAEIHCPRRPNYKTILHAPGFWAQIEGLVATDSSWEVMTDLSHNPKAPLYTIQIGFSEWKDLSAEPVGWRLGKDKKSKWQKAKETVETENRGGRIITPRPIEPLTCDIVSPLKVTDVGYVPDECDETNSPHYAELMSAEHYFSVAQCLENPEGIIGKSSQPAVLFRSDRNSWLKGNYLIVDFGQEVIGNLVLDVDASAGTVVDVAYDEMLGDHFPLFRPGVYYFTDRFVLRSGRQRIEQRLHSRGFRYLKMVFRNVKGPIRIHSVQLVNRIYPQKTQASFDCEDTFWNRLWQACVNTIRMCSTDTFMDCPWREQGFWINDHSVVNLFYLQSTGDKIFAGHNLRLAADGALPNGLIPAVYPSNHTRLFPMIPASWTVSLYDYLLYTGDIALVTELASVMEKGLSVYDTWRNSDGLIPNQPKLRNFIDWGYELAGVELSGVTAVLNMYVAAGYKCAGKIEEALGNNAKAKKYSDKSLQAIKNLNRKLWDSRKGCYRDCTKPMAGKSTFSQHPHALGLYFNLLKDPQRRLSIANLLNPSFIQAELFHQHYVLGALTSHGKEKDAVSVIKSLWSEMIESGSDTIWESIQGRACYGGAGSLCHAFACAPIHFMQSGILGVKPIEPGFRVFSFNPRLIAFKNVRGEIPTPHGKISVSWRKNRRGKTVVKLLVPEGACAVTRNGIDYKCGVHELVWPEK